MGYYKLGKLDPEPKDVEKALQFKDLAPVTLPTIPGMYDAFADVYSSVGISDPTVLFPLDGNGPDPAVPTKKGYGNCVECMKAHGRTVYAGLVGQKIIPAAPAVVQQYLKETHGEDSGLNISRSLDDWIANGAFGEQPIVKVYIDPSNWDHVRLGLFLFKYLHTGTSCTDAMQTQFSNRQVWDGSGEDEGGHGIGVGGFGLSLPSWGDGLIKLLTWGNDQYGNLNWWENKVDECWIVASQEMTTNAAKFCPEFTGNLLDAMQAIADQEN